MPQLSDTMTEGVVVTWEKQAGDRVERGDIVATVETDKAIMDVEVFKAGYLAGPLAEVGASVAVGAPLGYITDTQGDLAIAQDEVVTEKAPSEMIPHHAGHAVVMPQLSDTMTEGVVVTWEKNIGDAIKRGDIVATVETDKAIMDVEVFQDGFLSGPLADVGSTIEVGHPMAFIVSDAGKVVDTAVIITADHKVTDVHHKGAAPAAEKPAMAAPAAKPAAAPAPKPAAPAAAPAIAAGAKPVPRAPGRKASPYARKVAGALGVDIGGIAGSGPEGVITASDVQRARPSMKEVAASLPQVDVPGEGRPMTSMEKAVSHAMTASLTLPTFNATMNIDISKLTAAAKARGVSVTVAIAKACSVAMQNWPRMNWAYQPMDKLVERSNHDFGIAVKSDDGGLVVPILAGIESKSLEALQEAWNDLVPRARVRKLAPKEFANPTFTISNMGMFGITHFTAIPTPGIAAILAIAANTPQGTPFTITADHRVLNGADVAGYLVDLKNTIEHPESWLVGAEAPPAQPIPEGNWDTQVLVIGGGPGGEDCARDLADHGIKVVMVNNAPLPGGECLWRGCIPSKAWRHAADIIRDRAHDADKGVTGTDKPKMVWETLEAHRKNVLQTRGELALKTDKGVKIDVREGFASFIDAHTAEIKPASGDAYKITFGAAVIATGAPPFVPPIPGAKEGLESGGVITSDTVWNLPKPPKKLGIIGGGVIGVEMAQIWKDFGADVLMLEHKDRILAEIEEEIAKQLTGILTAEFQVVTSARIAEISGKPGKMVIKYADAEGKAQEYACDYVLMATGKRPDTSKLNLDKAGVALDGAAIKVDAAGRTSTPHIYAVGDVIGGYMLAHTAATQGRVAAHNLTGHAAKYNQDLDCGVTFSRPEAGFVGLSVAQAKAKGIDAVEAKIPMNIDAKAMIALETHGMIKLVADKATQKIIGAHFLADHTDTLIGAAVMMVSGGMTLTQVAESIFPHPTQTELFGELARRLLARLRRTAKAKA
jgi:dihydrolipoamide dehydrogenase